MSRPIGISDLSAEQQLNYGEDNSWLDDIDTSPSIPEMGDGDAFDEEKEGQPRVVYGKFNSITGKSGTKASRNNNPGNITGMGGKLLYGAVAFAKSNTGDAGDHNQLVYKTPQAGFEAMHRLAVTRYSKGPIKKAFSKWQTDQKSFQNKLRDLKKFGVDINKPYSKLSKEDQKLFRKIWSQHEGYRGKFY